MALTREQVNMLAKIAHRDAKPNGKPDATAEASTRSLVGGVRPDWAARAVARDARSPAHSDETKPAWLIKGWLDLTDAERAEFRAMEWEDFKTAEERVQAMALQHQRLMPPKL